MIAKKGMTRLAGILMAAAVLACVLAMAYPEKAAEALGQSAVTMQYASELFDTDRIIQIDIQMEEADWEKMLAEAMAEEYYACDVVINGRKIDNVGIRPKGNTSLSAIAMDPETDRFSLKLEFDHYVEGQTCLGLDKLILNNNYADATNMKEAIVYNMYQFLGADASLYNYAELSVNGEYRGLYLALEAVEESFLLRNYGTEDGELYKPEGMGFGAGGQGAPGGEIPSEGEMPKKPGEGEGVPGGGMLEASEEGEEVPGEERPEPSGEEEFSGAGMRKPPGNGEPKGGMDRPPQEEGGRWEDGMKPPQERENSGGADLNYTDDSLESYSVIWEGEVTDTGKKDHRRVVTALENIADGTDLEEYLDVDNVLKYMAVHTFSVNMDSLTGNMAHNYYLYEYDGKLNILPWDYNLSFGGMGMGAGGKDGALEMINKAVDTPFDGTEFFDVLLEREEYLDRYHEYLRKLAEEYVSGGGFEEVYRHIRNRIDRLAGTDPTAFYTYGEYEAGADMLYRTIQLRAKSILGQLKGEIPSTKEGQRENPSTLVDASGIDMGVMGTFDMGRK